MEAILIICPLVFFKLLSNRFDKIIGAVKFTSIISFIFFNDISSWGLKIPTPAQLTKIFISTF
jgi:ABC-type amino acid transport system permease subunit